MKKLLLVSSLLFTTTMIVNAQINKMYKSTNTSINTKQYKNNNVIKQSSSERPVTSTQVKKSYFGMINISADIYSKMETEWQASPGQFGGNHLKAELWIVAYQPDLQKPGYTKILLQQQVSTINLSYLAITGGVSYSINTLPAGNNLAVIVFSSPLNSVPDLHIKGMPDDGTGQKSGHHYESNAKSKLGQNIIYGIYSIVPGKTDLNHLDFSFLIVDPFGASSCKTCFSLGEIAGFVSDIGDFAKAVINGITYVFDKTIDGITGLAKFVFQGAMDIDGFFINEAGQIFYEVAGGLVNLIVFGNLPQERSIHQDEYDWANKEIFNQTLPEIDRIKIFNFMNPDKHRFYTWPSPDGYHIYMNIGDAFDYPMSYVDNINHAYNVPGQVFIHELTHAWQAFHYGFPGMMERYIAGGGLSQSYDPGCTINNINSNFNLEQQATLVDRTYLQIYYQQTDKKSCQSFQQQWVENNIRGGIKFDLNAIAATIAITNHANDPAIKPFIGNLVQAQAVYSKGNSTDGNGYYMSGSIAGSFLYYNNQDKKAYANWGLIRKKYEAEGMEFGILGWPVDDNKSVPRRQGAYQFFKRGAIYYSPATGTFFLSGLIQKKWNEMGYENSRLGFPKSDPVTSGNSNSRLMPSSLIKSTTQLFEGGELFLEATNNSLAVNAGSTEPVHVIYNNLLGVWNSGFGFPISDQVSIPAKPASIIIHRLSIPAFDSVSCHNADIYWCNNFGAHVVTGEIRKAYKSLGGSVSTLGLPTSDQQKPAVNNNLNNMVSLHIGDYYQQFQGGAIYYTGGKISVQYKIDPAQNIQNQNIQNKSNTRIKKIGN